MIPTPHPPRVAAPGAQNRRDVAESIIRGLEAQCAQMRAALEIAQVVCAVVAGPLPEKAELCATWDHIDAVLTSTDAGRDWLSLAEVEALLASEREACRVAARKENQ